jgi:kynureninase
MPSESNTPHWLARQKGSGHLLGDRGPGRSSAEIFVYRENRDQSAWKISGWHKGTNRHFALGQAL